MLEINICLIINNPSWDDWVSRLYIRFVGS